MGNQQGPEVKVDILAEIVITFRKDEKVHMTGPLDEKMLCYGMLEMARDIVRAHNQGEKKMVEVPNLVLDHTRVGRG
jgi:hypothetical protein